MISHDNLVFATSAFLEITERYTRLNQRCEEERCLSYLPLSHVVGILNDIMAPLVTTSRGPGWGVTFFARPYDLKVGSLGDRLGAVKPTIFCRVPRVWEKIAEKVQAIGASKPSSVRAFMGWCKRKVLAHQKNCQLGGSGHTK